MATIINNPGSAPQEESGMNWAITLVVLILIAIIFFAYALPALRRNSAPSSGTNINVPERVDVNVNTPQQ